MTASLTAVARHLSFIRETEGPNRGAWVSMLQRFCGGIDGDSWCSDFLSFVLDIAYHGHPPIHRTGSAQELLSAARTKGDIVSTPQPDDLFFYVNTVGHAHHVGILTGVNPLVGIAGNTSPDGQSDNGTGVYEHAISGDPSRVVFVRLPNDGSIAETMNPVITRVVASVGLLILLLVPSAAAQTPVTGASTLRWTQAAATLAVANGYRYDAVIDTLAPVTVLAVVCSGATSPYSCVGNFPAATPGVTHTVTLAATDASVTPPLSSAPTAAISFRFVIAPATPGALAIVP